MKFFRQYQTELLALFILVVVYFALRLPNLTLQPIFADEAIYIRWAQVMKSEPTLRFLPLSDGKTPLFMWMMIPLFKVFSDPLFAGRFLSIISGLFTLLGVFFLSRKFFNNKVASWATLFYVITPYTVFFDRMALVDSMLSAFTIWSLYFTMWVIRNLRLDLAMILGYLLGSALLTKTPAMMSILVLPVTLLALKKNSQGKYPILKALVLLVVASLIAFFMYNLLRLGPNFHLLSGRNADYIFSPFELVNRPLDPFIPHLRDMVDWYPKLFSLPILVLVGLGVYYITFSFNKLGLAILAWALIPLLLEMILLKTFTARYLLTSVAPSLIFAGFGLTKVLEKVKIGNNLKTVIVLIAVLPIALRFNYQLITNPPPQGLPNEERRGYFEDWTAGYGLFDIADFLKEERKKGKVVVGTQGFFGTLPDGLYIYLDKDDIAIVGSGATISAQIRESAQDSPTYFVGNKKNIRGNIQNADLIKEYQKTKPLDGSEQDAMVLYRILP